MRDEVCYPSSVLKTLTAVLISSIAAFHPHHHKPLGSHFEVNSTCYAQGGLTASGTQAHFGEVASNALRLGSWIKLDRSAFGRRVFRVEDRIGSGSELDIYYPSEAACEQYGRQERGFRLLTSR